MYRTRNSISLRISIRMCTHKSVSIPYPKSKRIPFRNRTDTIYSRLNTFLLRTVTNLGYGYKRDPIRIRINLSREFHAHRHATPSCRTDTTHITAHGRGQALHTVCTQPSLCRSGPLWPNNGRRSESNSALEPQAGARKDESVPGTVSMPSTIARSWSHWA